MKVDKVREKQKIDEILDRCYVQLKALGIPVAPRKNISVEMYPRLSALAYCEKLEGGKFQIKLPESCYRELGEKPETRRRMLHELLHTCPKCMTHGPAYNEYRRAVKKALGIDVFDAIDDPASSHLPMLVSEPCKECGCSYEYHKPSKKNLHLKESLQELYANRGYATCRFCHGRIPLFRIRFAEDMEKQGGTK